MSSISYFSPKHLLLDIETSGLQRETDQVICIGVCYCAHHEIVTKQWLLSHCEDEKTFLESFAAFTQNFERVYTYNGKGFDWPFLLARFSAYGLSNLLSHLTLVDMKKSLSKLSTKRHDLEAILAYQRQTQTEGKQLATLCKTYLTCQDAVYASLIKAHNQDELGSLLTFYELYQILYHIRGLTPIQTLTQEGLVIETLKLPSATQLTACLTLPHCILTLTKDSTSMTLSAPIWHLTLSQPLKPLKDYRFIVSQNMIMHQSLAQFIPKSDQRKPTKAECRVTQEGDYLKLYSTYRIDLPLWQDEKADYYIMYTPSQALPSCYYHTVFYYFFQENKA